MSTVTFPRVPSYRLHKPTGQAVATINGRDRYLGRHNSAASRQEYKRLIAEWAATGGSPADNAELTVAEVIQRFRRYAESYYRGPDGQQTCEVDNIRKACRLLRLLYGDTAAKDFGPLALQAVRGSLIDKGYCRTSINRDIGRIKLMFKWSGSQELIPASVYHGLQTVAGLRIGRSGAKESDPVKPVPQAFVDGVLDHVPPTVAALINLQLLTAARPGELLIMRTGDLDTSGRIWTYTPERHKTAHRGHRRTIYIGPRAQAILRPFLKTDLTAFLFSPAEAVQQFRAIRHTQRITALSCGNRPGTNRQRKPRWTPGNKYSVHSYARAIARGCDKAFPAPKDATEDETRQWRKAHRWSPHRLRHNAATNLRKEFGLDVARIVLGHRSAAITEVYAELDHGKALEVIGRVG
ncbi:MAG TPA: site-specific integrase [Pirellulales bacterium]|nr:site-specific integrase [Pirellulales bacterium]